MPKRFRFKMGALLVAVISVFALTIQPASAGSSWSGTKTTVTGTTWQGWVWGGIQNPVAGYNMYLRIDSADTPTIYVKWVSCSGASSGALRLSGTSPFQGALGTGFIYNACALPYSRFVNTSASGTHVAPFETYFDNHFHS